MKLIERNQAYHAEAYERVLSDFGYHVTDPQVHLLRGAATQLIPQFCEHHQMDLLVCGTVARSGISGLMIGNTANRMLNKVQCSILALARRGFERTDVGAGRAIGEVKC